MPRLHAATTLALGVSLLATACASAPGRVTALPPALLASAPTSDHYETAPLAPSADGSAGALFERSLDPAVRARFAHAPALDALASTYADVFIAADAPPSRALAQWLFWRAGRAEPCVDLEFNWVSGRSRTPRLDEWVAFEAQKKRAPTDAQEFGAARRESGQWTVQMLAEGTRAIALDALPKSHAPGGTLALDGALVDGHTNLVLYADEVGGVAREPVKVGDDGRFSIRRALPTQPGRYFVELAAKPRGGGGASTLLWAPLYVGVAEPATPDELTRAGEAGPHGIDGVGAALLAAVNTARAAVGRRPARLDERLVALARERAAALDAGAPPAADEEAKVKALGLEPARAGWFTVASAHASGELGGLVAQEIHLRALRPSFRRRWVASEDAVVGAVATERRKTSDAGSEHVGWRVVFYVTRPAP